MDYILAFFAARTPGYRISKGRAAWTAPFLRQFPNGRTQPLSNLYTLARRPNYRLIVRPPLGMLTVDLDDNASEDSRYLVGDDLDDEGVPHYFLPSSAVLLPEESYLFPERKLQQHDHLFVVPRTPEELEFWREDLANRFGWAALRFEGVAVPGTAYKISKVQRSKPLVVEDKYGNKKKIWSMWDATVRERMKRIVDLDTLKEFVLFLQSVEPLLPVVEQQAREIEQAKEARRRARRARMKKEAATPWVAPRRPDTLPARLEAMLDEDVGLGFRSERQLKLCITAKMFGFDVEDIDRWTDEGRVGLSGYMLKHVGNGVVKDDREWGRRRLREYDWPKACEVVANLPAGRKAAAVERAVECGVKGAELDVYISLARCRGTVLMSHGELEASTGYSKVYVNQMLNRLVERGALRLIGKKASFGTRFAQQYELLVMEKPQQNQLSEQKLDITLGGWALVRAAAEMKQLMIPLRWEVRADGAVSTVSELLLKGLSVDEVLDLMGDVVRFAAKRRTVEFRKVLSARRRDYYRALGRGERRDQDVVVDRAA